MASYKKSLVANSSNMYRLFILVLFVSLVNLIHAQKINVDIQADAVCYYSSIESLFTKDIPAKVVFILPEAVVHGKSSSTGCGWIITFSISLLYLFFYYLDKNYRINLYILANYKISCICSLMYNFQLRISIEITVCMIFIDCVDFIRII